MSSQSQTANGPQFTVRALKGLLEVLGSQWTDLILSQGEEGIAEVEAEVVEHVVEAREVAKLRKSITQLVAGKTIF